MNNNNISFYYNTTLSQFEIPGISKQDIPINSNGKERTIAYNFVMISLSDVTFKMRNYLYLFDYFDEESGIRLIGYCVPIFVYRRFFVGRVPLNHREIIRRKFGNPGNPHDSFLKYIKIPIVSVEPKYPTNWLKYIINGCPDVYPYSQLSSNSYYNNENIIIQKNIINSLAPNCTVDFYKLNNCPYLIPFRTFDCIICYMLIFSNCEGNSERISNIFTSK